jgi:hypothetical protein
MPAKKPRQQKQPEMTTMNTTTTSGSDSDDTIVISGSSDTTIDLGNYGAAQSVYTLGNIDTITLDPSYSITGSTAIWTSNYNYGDITLTNSQSPKVNINNDGISMDAEADIKVGDRSLKDFMDRVEDRLAILHPNEALEDRWEQLKDLRRQYEALEKDILEKEKIMKILKEK